jgi:hypothetical protein
MNNDNPNAPKPITLEAVMTEMNQSAERGEEDRPVDKNGRPLTASQLAYRERVRQRRNGRGPTTFFNILTGKQEPLK